MSISTKLKIASYLGSAIVTAPFYVDGVKYLYDTMGTPNRTPANNVPSTADKLKNLGTRKKVAPLADNTKNILAKKKNLGSLASGTSAALALGAGVIGSMSTDSLGQIQTASDATKKANDDQKNLQGDSHFLNNQVNLKQSLDYTIDAINAQTVALFQAISPISMHLAALVTAVQASTDAILGLDPAVTLPELAPVIKVPDAPAPVVNVAPSPVSVAPSTATIEVKVPQSPAPTVNVEAPIIPDYTKQMDRMADSADAVKEHHEYLKTPLQAPDTTTETGTLELSPRDAKHALNAHHARGEADENEIGGDLFSHLEDLYDGEEMKMIKLLPFTRIDSGFGSLNDADNSSYDSMIDARYQI